ncbi:MAG: MFS transporter [Burkholderiales bacterium]
MTRWVSAEQRPLAGLITGQVCLHSAMAGLRLATPLMLLQSGGFLGLSPAASAGVMVALFAMAPVLTSMHVGRWVDRRGYHEPVRAAVVMSLLGGLLALPSAWLDAAGAWDVLRTLLLAAGATLLGTAANLTQICGQRTAARLAALAGPAHGVPADSAEAARQHNEIIKRMFSWQGLAAPLSNMIGPMLAGACIDLGGFTSAYAVIAVLPLATLAFMRWVPREQGLREQREQAAATPRPGLLQSARELLALPGMGRLLLINWCFSTSWDLFSFLVPLHGHGLGLSASAIGSVLGMFAFMVAVSRLVLPVLARGRSEASVITLCYVVTAAMFVLYPHTRHAWQMLVLAAPIGLALGAVQPMVMTALHHLTPADRHGEAIALRSACISLSSAVLPMCYGVLGGVLGGAFLFRGMAVVLLVGARLPSRLRLPKFEA